MSSTPYAVENCECNVCHKWSTVCLYHPEGVMASDATIEWRCPNGHWNEKNGWGGPFNLASCPGDSIDGEVIDPDIAETV